jgi:hypothetical protein
MGSGIGKRGTRGQKQSQESHVRDRETGTRIPKRHKGERVLPRLPSAPNDPWEMLKVWIDMAIP